jgi:hypothetical protein
MDIFGGMFDPDWVLDDADTIPDNDPEPTIGEYWDDESPDTDDAALW